MNAWLLHLGAGSGAANNLVRSLRACDRSMAIIGAHHDRFVLRGAPTERRYLLPSLSHPGFVGAVNRLIAAERIDVLIPTSDADVRTLAATRPSLGCRTPSTGGAEPSLARRSSPTASRSSPTPTSGSRTSAAPPRPRGSACPHSGAASSTDGSATS